MTRLSFLARHAVLGTTVALSLSACVVTPYPTGQDIYGNAVVTMPPPAPYAEVVPAMPYAGAIWINGYWGWQQGRHHWVPGRYERARPGYRWEPHRWQQAPRGGWHQRGGRWAR